MQKAREIAAVKLLILRGPSSYTSCPPEGMRNI